ncbi:hypothetical protein AS005_01070 [Thermotoga sp. KOL6]|nr:hypothetical protein AS005_01070 [Thermotoga sp. KOL6]
MIYNKPVLTKNFKEKPLNISFNPIMEKFEVTNAAIEKDPRWIKNISEILLPENSTYKVIQKYLRDLKSKLSDERYDEEIIASRIEKLRRILSYPLNVIELSHTLDPETVAEIFVRINSTGKSLNQSDFILTLLSLYWNEGRKELEKFCESSRMFPEDNTSSSYNIIGIKPDPEYLVRATVGYSFRKGRLRYAYLILKGRDFENKTISENLRVKNINLYKEGHQKVVNLTNWHDFVKIIYSSGFVNDRLINSKIAFFVSYTLYLIGRYDFTIHHKELESIIRKWFVFSVLTQRYNTSTETLIEQDFSSLKSDFIGDLKKIMDAELTQDFWGITLPERLNSSSIENPAFRVYTAALVYNDENVFLSDIKLRDYLSPAVKNVRKKMIDLHHIFPKAYLKRIGYKENKLINQVANLVYIEYKDNLEISDKPPYEYWKEITKFYPEDKIENHIRSHDIPNGFWGMTYEEFLAERRKMMAARIRKYFTKL